MEAKNEWIQCFKKVFGTIVMGRYRGWPSYARHQRALPSAFGDYLHRRRPMRPGVLLSPRGVVTMAGINYSTLLQQLLSSGVPSTVASSITSGLSGLFTQQTAAATAINGLLTQVQIVQGDAAEVAALVTQILSIPNCPVQIDGLVMTLKAAVGNPLLMAETIAQIQNILHVSTSQSGMSNILSSISKAL
jgi:hypothetical protein